MFYKFDEIIKEVNEPFVIEIGAGNGYVSRTLLDRLQHSGKKYIYHLFEPNNNLTRTIVDLLQYYLSTFHSMVKFYKEAIFDKNGKEYLSFKDSSKKQLCNTITFDSHIERIGIVDKCIDLVWFNANGSELNFIQGGKNTLTNVNYIYICYSNLCVKEKLINELINFDFIEDFETHLLFKNKN